MLPFVRPHDRTSTHGCSSPQSALACWRLTFAADDTLRRRGWSGAHSRHCALVLRGLLSTRHTVKRLLLLLRFTSGVTASHGAIWHARNSAKLQIDMCMDEPSLVGTTRLHEGEAALLAACRQQLQGSHACLEHRSVCSRPNRQASGTTIGRQVGWQLGWHTSWLPLSTRWTAALDELLQGHCSDSADWLRSATLVNMATRRLKYTTLNGKRRGGDVRRVP